MWEWVNLFLKWIRKSSCKTLQDDLHKEKLFNDEIVELKQENEELKNENFKLRRRITVVSRNLKEEKDSLDEILCGPTND